MSVMRTLAPTENPLFSQAGMSAAEVIGDRAAEGGKRPVVAVGDAPQERQADLMELGVGHRG